MDQYAVPVPPRYRYRSRSSFCSSILVTETGTEPLSTFPFEQALLA